MNKTIFSGFTLFEMLVVVVILGIVSVVAIPILSNNDQQKLDVATEETVNFLRFALSEAKSKNKFILVDGKTVPGVLKLYYSDSSANPILPINDPLTKSISNLDVTNTVFSQEVIMTPHFMADGDSFPQLLISPNITQIKSFDGVGNDEGLLGANSGVLLAYGTKNVMVGINQTTGLVTFP